MARKPSHAKPQGKAQAVLKAKAKVKRQAKKHQATHRALRFKVLLSPFMRLWGRMPPSIRVPGMDHDVATVHVLAFVAILGIAIGGGYGGARALFGSGTPHAQNAVTHQIASQYVILPEVNGDGQLGARAYEEKVAEEIYIAPEPHPVPTVSEEVASLPPAAEPPVVPTGTQPLWLKNALNVPMPSGGPMIAIVIDDMGVDRKRSRHMWEDVPGPLTLSFMTYADDLPAQTREAYGRGHELMLHMSMEPSLASIDPGPNVLMTAMGDGELKSLANWGMDRFEGFVGVNNHMGSHFTEDARAMQTVLAEVQKRGLLFLDSRTSSKSVGRRVARQLGMTFLERNVFLDNDNDVDKVRHQLDQVENLARKQGFAIAIGHPRDATIEVLKTWIPQARERGLNIVPVTMILKARALSATQVGQSGSEPQG